MVRFLLVFLCSFYGVSLQAQWQSVSYPTSQQLLDICFTSDSTGFIAADNGLILKSTDFGNTWSVCAALNEPITSICSLGYDTIFAGGNNIYRSTDAGNTWNLLSSLSYKITDLLYFSSTHATSIAPYYYTCSWSGGTVNMVDFIAYMSNDGGLSWQVEFSGLDGNSQFQQIDDSIAYVSGVYHTSTIHCAGPAYIQAQRTSNNGVNWAYPTSSFPAYYGFHLLNDTMGHFLGYGSSNFAQTLFKKTGNSVSQIKKLSTPFYQIHFINEIDGYAFNNNTIFNSGSGGYVWNTDTIIQNNVKKLYNSHDQYLFAIGDSGTIFKKEIIQSQYPDSIYLLNTSITSLDFDTILAGGNKQLQLELYNDGSMPLNINVFTSSVYFLSLDAINFASSLSFTTPPGLSTTVFVKFSPADTISYLDSIFVSANNIPGITIPLIGTGSSYLSGTISGALSLCADTLFVTGNIIVDSTGILTICPGTVVYFLGSFYINVRGILKAAGTINDSIIFIPADTTAGWSSIRFQYYAGTDTSVLSFCRISHVKIGYAVNIDNTANILVEQCNISHSRGGVRCWASTEVIIRNNKIHDNNSGFFEGGGITTTNSDPLIINNHIYNNYRSGIHSFNQLPPYPNIIQNLVFNNYASFGAGMYIRGGSPDIFNNIICNNLAFNTTSQGGLALSWDTDSACVVENNIIYNNQTNQLYVPPGITAVINYNNIQNGYTGGTGNIDQSPMFVDPTDSVGNMTNIGNYDWSLSIGSACINAGDPVLYPLVPNVDIAGNPRVYNNVRIDMGAYEFQGNTGLNSISESHLLLHPNPASNSTQIKFTPNSISSINIFELTGRLLLHFDIHHQNSIELDLHTIPAGTYLVECAGMGKSVFKKLVIAKQ